MSVLLLLAFAAPALAQTAEDASVAVLPDAPRPSLAEAQSTGPAPSAAVRQSGTIVAPITEKYIPDGVQAPPLTAADKIDQTAHDLYTPASFIGFVVAAGYSHIVRGQPNYGADRAAFGQRIGAAAIRDTSQDVFQGMVFAPLLHQDPRYYREGDSYSVPHRLLYAITRPLITRDDDGHQRLNSSLLLGYASAAGLTAAYYPESNHNLHDVSSTFGASIGGAALGFAFREFTGDATRLIHRHHTEGQ
ncbi:hypothetical protein GOB94_07425 [Granulicella sp. 5B5]|uniref:hypothetical protein n=1 Tax=Granulicella sp. 5B5 TaxID=1617967 RepID=UPI0015F64BF8|nr:hypothetical protein [Granulicella sp. 5B5]QMV18534.1 hypothetical protein GOB94_07425 [Granulicella sp. 5B5]